MVANAEGSPHDLGAKAHTNNTGELSAVYYAVKSAQSRTPGQGREEIRSDSLYAIHMTEGTWMPRQPRNREMIALLRTEWRKLQRARPGEVTFRHVRSHAQRPGNELADWLADRGTLMVDETPATDETLRHEAHQWLTRWIAGHPSATRTDARHDEREPLRTAGAAGGSCCDATPTPERATVAGEDEERWRQGRPPGTPVSSDPAG